MKLKSNSSPSIKKVVITSFLVDISDLMLNILVAIFSGSIVMLSQALQGASDLLASALLLIGLERSKKASDKTYPFGYGRELYFWTMMAALVMLGVTSTLSILFGWQRIMHPEPVEHVPFAFGILMFGLFTNLYALSLSYKRIFTNKHHRFSLFRIFSRSPMIETKTTFVLDLMGTLASVLGMWALFVYAITGDSRYDGFGAIVIGIVLAILSFVLLDGVRDMIVGRSASEETEKQIKHAALKLAEVEEVLDLKTMYIGPANILVNIEVHIVHKLKTQKIEKLIDKIKKNIKADVPSVRHVQVELETPTK